MKECRGENKWSAKRVNLKMKDFIQVYDLENT